MDTWTEVGHPFDRDQIEGDQTGTLADQTEEVEMALMVHQGEILAVIVMVEWTEVWTGVHPKDLVIHQCHGEIILLVLGTLVEEDLLIVG